MRQNYSLLKQVAMKNGVIEIEETDEVRKTRQLLWNAIDDHRGINDRIKAICDLDLGIVAKYYIPSEERYHRSRVGSYFQGYMLLSSKKQDKVDGEYFVYYIKFG